MATTRGGARWMNALWRYRESGELGWTYAPTIADVYADNVDNVERPIEVQKRTGTRRAGYDYELHTILNPERPPV